MGKLLTTHNVAEALGYSAETVRELAEEGILEAIRLRPTSQLRFREADV